MSFIRLFNLMDAFAHTSSCGIVALMRIAKNPN